MSDAGELRILINPDDPEGEAGARFLTRCFATRWTDGMYRWYLQRAFGGEAPDRVILAEGARPVAGCGLVYRQLRTPDGALHRVSVVVAACTLPDERGRGLYARVLQAAVERSAERGCTALLGFVTAENATGRGLRRLGAAAIASAYIGSRQRRPMPGASPLRLRETRVADDWPARAAAAASAAFHYPDVSAWRSQIVDRPQPVDSVRIGATCRAVIEPVGDTDRLQWLDGEARERSAAIRALVTRAGCRKRKFFMYSTCPQEAAAARRLGLDVHPGYLMARAVQAGAAARVRAWGGLNGRIQSGDRM
jgi:GNAT superfamily N-acetyltransferase